LRLIIGSLLIFSLVILFLFALFPSEISVSRVISINRPRAEVMKKIADLRQWKNWNDFLYDPRGLGVVPTTTEKEDSLQIVQARVTVDLVKIDQDTVITRWEQGNKSFLSDYVLREDKGRTMLSWTLYFHISWYPWEKLASMFYEKQLGPSMEISLIKLRNELELPTH